MLVNNLAGIQSQGSNLVSPKPDVVCWCKAISHPGHIRSRELRDMWSLIKGKGKKKKEGKEKEGTGRRRGRQCVCPEKQQRSRHTAPHVH